MNTIDWVIDTHGVRNQETKSKFNYKLKHLYYFLGHNQILTQYQCPQPPRAYDQPCFCFMFSLVERDWWSSANKWNSEVKQPGLMHCGIFPPISLSAYELWFDKTKTSPDHTITFMALNINKMTGVQEGGGCFSDVPKLEFDMAVGRRVNF